MFSEFLSNYLYSLRNPLLKTLKTYPTNDCVCPENTKRIFTFGFLHSSRPFLRFTHSYEPYLHTRTHSATTRGTPERVERIEKCLTGLRWGSVPHHVCVIYHFLTPELHCISCLLGVVRSCIQSRFVNDHRMILMRIYTNRRAMG